MSADLPITAGTRVMVADVDGNEHGAIALSGVESEGHASPVVWVAGGDPLSEEDIAALLDDRPLTVGKLRELLADLPDDLLVVLQKDPEGNGYLPAAGAEWDQEAAYFPRERRVLTAEDREYLAEEEWGEDAAEEDELGPGVPALVLWPTECSADVVLAMPRPVVAAPPVAGR